MADAAKKLPTTKAEQLDWGGGWVPVRSFKSTQPLPWKVTTGIQVGNAVNGWGEIAGVVEAIDLHVASGAIRITVQPPGAEKALPPKRFAVFYPGGVLVEVAGS